MHTGNSEAVSIINNIRLRLSKAKNGLNGLPYMLIVSVAKNPSNPLKPLYIYIYNGILTHSPALPGGAGEGGVHFSR